MVNSILPDIKNQTNIYKNLSDFLREGDFDEAEKFICDNFNLSSSSFGQNALMVILFWKDCFAHYDLISNNSNDQKGHFLIRQWVLFYEGFKKLRPLLCDELSQLRYFIFEQASIQFKSIESSSIDIDHLLNLSRCYKGMDDYKTARIYLEKCFSKNQKDPKILAEFADILDLSNEEKMAKVFFREAFFFGPENIDLAFIDSPIITKTIEKILEKEYDEISEVVLKNLIPIYGVIYGVLNIKRELKTIELGRLKQSIFEMERKPDKDSVQKAKLLNHYFWLIDHIQVSNKGNTVSSRDSISTVLQKIKLLDSRIYQYYTK